MSMKAIADVEAAEAQARQLKADAAQQAKNAAAEAEAQGPESPGGRPAESRRGTSDAQRKGGWTDTGRRSGLLRETEAQKDRLRTQGESRLDQAARQIAERIVNG